MKILDLSAGNRAIWFDRFYRDTVYVDRRAEVNPTIVADSRALPIETGDAYDLIVFDPPHANLGANGKMSSRYGHHTASEIRSIVEGTAKEAHRVSRHDALMSFKWNNHDQSFKNILELMAPWWEPLFGQKTSERTRRLCSTQWILLRRRS